MALSRDDALYDVALLERAYGVSPCGDDPSADFFTRVIALGCASLRDLDARLLSGDRPGSARIRDRVPTSPCDPERASVWCAPAAEGWPRLGHARSMLGQDGLVDLPGAQPDADVYLAALIDEDLERASDESARSAIAGYAVLLEWFDAAAPQSGRGLRLQLGPVLETGPLPRGEALAVRLTGPERGRDVAHVIPGQQAPTAIARASERVRLGAGDIVAIGPLGPSVRQSGAAPNLDFHQDVSAQIRAVGTLRGRAVPRRNESR